LIREFVFLFVEFMSLNYLDTAFRRIFSCSEVFCLFLMIKT